VKQQNHNKYCVIGLCDVLCCDVLRYDLLYSSGVASCISANQISQSTISLSNLPSSTTLINFIVYVTDNSQNHGNSNGNGTGNGNGNGNGNGGSKRLIGADGKCYQVVRMYVTAKAFYEKVISDKKAKDKKNRRAEQVMAQGSKLTQNMAVTVLLGAITVGCVPQRRNSIVANEKTFLMNIAPVDGVRFECEKPVDESFLPFGLVSEKAERERVKEEEREREGERGAEAEMGIGGDEEVEVDDVEGVGEGEMKIEDAMNDAIGGEGGDNTQSGDRTGSASWSDNSEETRQRRGSADTDLPLSGHAHTDMNCDDATADNDTVLTYLSEFDPLNVRYRNVFMSCCAE
jgi:hypothetical protein